MSDLLTSPLIDLRKQVSSINPKEMKKGAQEQLLQYIDHQMSLDAHLKRHPEYYFKNHHSGSNLKISANFKDYWHNKINLPKGSSLGL